MEQVDLEEEELGEGIENINVDEEEPISQLPLYMSPRKLTTKVTKDPDGVRFSICTPFPPKYVPFEGEFLALVPQLHMEDWDLSYRAKLPHFEPRKYLKMVYYEEAGVMRIKPITWVAGIHYVGLLKMLFIPHFE